MKPDIEQLNKEFKDRFCYGAYMETEAQSPEEYTNDIWNFFLPHLISSDEIKREVIKEFANDILRASIKEIEWCRDNPDKAPGKSFGKGFVKGIEQVTHIIIPQLLRLFNDDLTQSKEGGE